MNIDKCTQELIIKSKVMLNYIFHEFSLIIVVYSKVRQNKGRDTGCFIYLPCIRFT